MRILITLAAVIVFVALFVIDTTALLRLTAYCVSGGCGVPPIWIAIGAAGLVLCSTLVLRRRRGDVKVARVKKAPAPRPAKMKAAPRKRPQRAKSKKLS